MAFQFTNGQVTFANGASNNTMNLTGQGTQFIKDMNKVIASISVDGVPNIGNIVTVKKIRYSIIRKLTQPLKGNRLKITLVLEPLED